MEDTKISRSKSVEESFTPTKIRSISVEESVLDEISINAVTILSPRAAQHSFYQNIGKTLYASLPVARGIFNGNHAVKMLIEKGFASDENEAIRVGNMLIQLDIISAVYGGEGEKVDFFSNSPQLYNFSKTLLEDSDAKPKSRTIREERSTRKLVKVFNHDPKKEIIKEDSKMSNQSYEIKASKTSYISVLALSNDGTTEAESDDDENDVNLPAATEEEENDEELDSTSDAIGFLEQISSILDVSLDTFFVIQRFFATVNQFSNRFSASDAISCIMTNFDSTNQSTAVDFCNLLYNKGLIKQYQVPSASASPPSPTFQAGPGHFYIFNDFSTDLLSPISLHKAQVSLSKLNIGIDASFLGSSPSPSPIEINKLHSVLHYQGVNCINKIYELNNNLIEGKQVVFAATQDIFKLEDDLKYINNIIRLSKESNNSSLFGVEDEINSSQRESLKKDIQEASKVIEEKTEYNSKLSQALVIVNKSLEIIKQKIKIFQIKSPLWNHRHTDKANLNTTQIEISIECSGIVLKKGGINKFVQLLVTKDAAQSNWVEISVAFHKDEAKKGETMSTTSTSLNTAHQWYPVARTDMISNTENPVYPCALLLECKDFSPNDKIKFDLFYKSTFSTSDNQLFGSVELEYHELERMADNYSTVKYAINTRIEVENEPTITLKVAKPKALKSEINKTYFHLGQTYSLLTEDHSILSVREQCVEVTYTLLVPLLYLRAREMEINENIKLLSSNVNNIEEKWELENVLFFYQGQSSKLELDWNRVNFFKYGQRCFKPSVAKKSPNTIAVPLNLHAQLIEVKSSSSSHVYCIMTMGAPSVHFFRYKKGGLRRLKRVNLSPKKRKITKSKATTLDKESKKMLEGYDSESDDENHTGKTKAYTLGAEISLPSKNIMRQGWLEKSSPGLVYESIKKRFFILNAKVGLEFYKGEDISAGMKPHGIITVESMIEVRKIGSSESGDFELVATKKVYKLKAASFDEANLWVMDIRELLMAPRNSLLIRAKSAHEMKKSSGADLVPPLDVAINGGGDLDGFKITEEEEDEDVSPAVSPGKGYTSIREKEIIKSGWMFKQKPQSATWQKRYFKLYPSSLQYFANDNNHSNPKNIIVLADIISSRYINDIKTIEIECADRVYVLKPESEEGQRWLYYIRKATAEAKGDTTFSETLQTTNSLLARILSGLVTEVTDGITLELRTRIDMAFSQALAACISAFTFKIENILNFNPIELIRMIKLGFLVSAESLLSTAGSEEGMIEDMEVAFKELATVSITLSTSNSNEVLLDNVKIHRKGGRTNVTLLLNKVLWNKLPSSLMEDKIPLVIFVVPLLFTQGINETQSLANRLGTNEIQTEINNENIKLLREYFSSFIDYHEGGKWIEACKLTKSENPIDKAILGIDIKYTKENYEEIRHKRIADLKEHMNILESVVRAARGSDKNFQILVQTSDLVSDLGGGRITCCKSGKDRTAMSSTYEQARILRDKYGVGKYKDDDSKKFLMNIEMMRRHGVRISNARKNTGKSVFAFNVFQRQMLPEIYRPPKSTCNKNVES